MKILVVYHSKTGFTKKYADWLGNELSCEVVPLNKIDRTFIAQYDLIIYGSRVYIGKVNKLNKFKDILSGSDKKWLVFAVGMTPENDTQAIQDIWINSLTSEEQETIPHFYMQGGLDYEKMNSLDRFIMKKVAKNSADDKKISTTSTDASSKRFIYPLTEFVDQKFR